MILIKWFMNSLHWLTILQRIQSPWSSSSVFFGRRLYLGLYSSQSTSFALGRHHETVGTANKINSRRHKMVCSICCSCHLEQSTNRAQTDVVHPFQTFVQKLRTFTPAPYCKSGAIEDCLHCALSLAAQCILIGPVCGFVCVCACVRVFVCLWVYYHDNSKLRASIFTKLGL